MTALYNRDFNLWIQQTVSDLKNKDMDAIDWNNLIIAFDLPDDASIDQSFALSDTFVEQSI